MSQEIKPENKINENKTEFVKEIKPEIKVESPEILKSEIKQKSKETIKNNINQNTKQEYKIIDNKISNLETKRPRFFGSIKNILFPSEPDNLRKSISSKFVIGLLIGSTLSYYLHHHEISAFLNNREALLKEEIKNLRKEVDHINRKDKI